LAHLPGKACVFDEHHQSMHPASVRADALDLLEQGLNDCEVARRIGVPRSTVREWRQPRYQLKSPRNLCPRCWRRTKMVRFTSKDYAELLGLYLGDGCISNQGRTARLRIFLDAAYPDIIRDTEALLAHSFPGNQVGVVGAHDGNMIVLSVYSSHLACLFPQEAGGKKHERPISLENWQLRIVEEAPWQFLRGCIRSDGCAFVNRTGPYEYLSYDFSNKSKDIVGLFMMTCGLVGLRYRVSSWRGSWRVRINRRESVDLMLAQVGMKS
jgi:hypothetical protein